MQARKLNTMSMNLSHAVPGLNFWGAALWVAWIMSMYSGEFFTGDASFILALTSESYFVSTFVFSLMCLVIGFAHQKTYNLISNPGFVLGCGCVVSLGTVCVLSAGELGPLFFLGNILTGCGTAWLAMRAGVFFSEITPRDSLIMAVYVQTLGALLYLFVVNIQQQDGILMLVILPICSAIMYFVGAEEIQVLGDGSRALPRRFLRFLVGVFILAMVFSTVRGYYPNVLQFEEFALSRDYATEVCFICFVLVIFVASMLKQSQIAHFNYWVLIALIFVTVIAPVFRLDSFVTGTYFAVCNSILSLVLWAMLAALSFRSGSSSLRVFGIGYPALMLGSTAGWGLGYYLELFEDNLLSEAMSFGLVVAVFAVAFFLFRQEDIVQMGTPLVDCAEGSLQSTSVDQEREHLRTIEEQSSSDTSSDRSAHADSSDGNNAVGGKRRSWWRLKMMAIAHDYDLSAREADVFLIMAKGKDAQAIAQELSISYNTARTHVRNIYTKLDVHSRSELLYFIEHEKVDFDDERPGK